MLSSPWHMCAAGVHLSQSLQLWSLQAVVSDELEILIQTNHSPAACRNRYEQISAASPSWPAFSSFLELYTCSQVFRSGAQPIIACRWWGYTPGAVLMQRSGPSMPLNCKDSRRAPASKVPVRISGPRVSIRIWAVGSKKRARSDGHRFWRRSPTIC